MNERLKLIQFLNALPESAIDVLEELCSLAGMPNGNFAGKSAPTGMKTAAILQWWESPLCNRNIMEL